MKPKTELQKQIVKLSGKLPALTEKQRRWGIMNAMDHVGLRLKKGLITCTHCGKIFYDLMKLEDGEMDICPNCGTHLKIETTTRKSCRDNEYFNIITTCHGFQVFRYFYIRKGGIVLYKRSCPELDVCRWEIQNNGPACKHALVLSRCMVSWH